MVDLNGTGEGRNGMHAWCDRAAHQSKELWIVNMLQKIVRKGQYEGEKMQNMVKYANSFETEHLISDPKMVVVGCGGAGNNSVDRLHRIGVWGAETIAINTDRAHLESIHADKRVLIGRRITHGQGAGGHPEVAEHCAEEAREELEMLLKGADITFITAGMGGGTGTGTAPVVAEIARELGSVVVSMATVPFAVEGRARNQRASMGLEKLKRNSDSTIVLANDKLLNIVPRMPIDQAFSVMDQMISEVIKEVTEAITQPSLINLDFADLRSVMSGGNTSTILYGENSANDPQTVVAEALNNPLLDIDYNGATSAFIQITSGPELDIRTTTEVVNEFSEIMDPNANIIFGARTEQQYEGQLKVMAIMNGCQLQFSDLPEYQMEPQAMNNYPMPLVR
jgi:cell division protein FtsZ